MTVLTKPKNIFTPVGQLPLKKLSIQHTGLYRVLILCIPIFNFHHLYILIPLVQLSKPNDRQQPPCLITVIIAPLIYSLPYNGQLSKKGITLCCNSSIFHNLQTVPIYIFTFIILFQAQIAEKTWNNYIHIGYQILHY